MRAKFIWKQLMLELDGTLKHGRRKNGLGEQEVSRGVEKH